MSWKRFCMPLADSNSSDEVSLKLLGFNSALKEWVVNTVTSHFFGESISLETGFRVSKFIQETLPSFTSDYFMIAGYTVGQPESRTSYLVIKLTFDLTDGHQISRSITIGQYVGYYENP